jgi:predicted dinucleotide-binding enzyme
MFEARRRKAILPDLAYSVDDPDAKGVAAGLIRDVGFDPVDAGPLLTARYSEPFSLLVVQLACVRGGRGPGAGIPVRAVRGADMTPGRVALVMGAGDSARRGD